MKKQSSLLARILLGLALFVLVLGIGGYVLVRSVLSPDKIRPLAEARLAEALGKPVTIGEMGIRLFPVPSLRAGEIHVGEATTEAPSLTIGSLRIVPSLRAALRRQVVIDHVDLDGLDVAVRRTRQGAWLLPYDPPKKTGASTTPAEESMPVTIRAVRIENGAFRLVDEAPAGGGAAREVAALRDIRGSLSAGMEGIQVESLAARFEETSFNGTATISPKTTRLDLSSPSIASKDLPQIFAFLGAAPIEGLSISGKAPFHLTVDIPQNGSIAASGEFDAATLQLGTLQLTSLKTPFKLAHDVVTLSPLTFTAYEGRQTGNVTLAIARNPMRYTIRTNLEGVNVDKALSANTEAKGVLSGTGRVKGNIEGAGFDEAALESRLKGTAEVALRKGVIKDLPLLAGINRALKITEGDEKDTRFESLDGTFAIGGGKAHTEDLRLKAGELSLMAKGDVHFNLTLAFKGTARFSATKSAELMRRVSELKNLANKQGELEIPLTISGPVAGPSVNVDLGSVMQRTLKRELKERLGDKLKDLFGN